MRIKGCTGCKDIKFVKKTSWFFRVLITIDQLGNTLADGDPDVTIFARVCYHSLNYSSGYYRHYCKAMEYVINFAFYLLDGKNLCLKALG